MFTGVNKVIVASQMSLINKCIASHIENEGDSDDEIIAQVVMSQKHERVCVTHYYENIVTQFPDDTFRFVLFT